MNNTDLQNMAREFALPHVRVAPMLPRKVEPLDRLECPEVGTGAKPKADDLLAADLDLRIADHPRDVPPSSRTSATDWTCIPCRYVNSPLRRKCFMCLTPKGSGKPATEADWKLGNWRQGCDDGTTPTGHGCEGTRRDDE